jgi:adenylate cyclase
MWEKLRALLPAALRVRLKAPKPDKLWLWAYGVIPTLFLISALGLRWADPPQLVDFRHWVFDNYQRALPRAYPAAAGVVIIDLDDESLEKMGQWPWPRTYLAAMVQNLNDAGARVVAFDMLFAEPDRSSPGRIADNFEVPPHLKSFLDELPDHDELFAQTVAPAPVVTGYVFTNKENDVKPSLKAHIFDSTKASFSVDAAVNNEKLTPAERIRRAAKKMKNKDLTAGTEFIGFLPNYYSGAIRNLEALENASSGSGSFSIVRDPDGIIRRVPLLFRLGERVYPGLAVEAMRVAHKQKAVKVVASGGEGEASFGAFTGIAKVEVVPDLLVPTDQHGRILLYDSGYEPERYISMWKVIAGQVDPARLKGAIAFVGTSAAGLKDLRATPLNQSAAGVAVHAQITEQMLTGKFLQRPDYAQGVEMTLQLVLGLLLILVMPKLGAAWLGAASLATLGATFAYSWNAFKSEGLLFDPVYPAIVITVIYLSASLINFLKTEYEKRHMKSTFGRYVSPDLVSRLADDPEQVKLGGENRDMTLMFSDIRGFTTISEQFDAEGLTEFINQYLTPMTAIVLEKKGTVDKYMGDCIMAFWNAPLDDAQHIENACDAALTMSTRLDELNEEWEAEAKAEGRKYIPIRAGIGLNTGLCCVGNMGSNLRLDYSVLGDEVNLASRLEGQSKTYGVNTVIGAKTFAVARERFACLELDLIQVKGKTVPVHIYTLLGDRALKETPAFEKLAVAHGAMISAYRAARFDEATAKIAECRELYSGLGGLYDLYDARIAAFAKEPPSGDWDGVFRATSK